MGTILDWFTYKSPEERQAEYDRYLRWAFPYGDVQKEKIAGLLSQLLPEETPQIAMTVYLIGREGYLGGPKLDQEERKARSEERKLTEGYKALSRQLRGGHRKTLSRYLALIRADEAADQELNYPTAEELRRLAEELEPRLAALSK